MSVSIRFVAISAGAAALALQVGCGQPPEDQASQGQGQQQAGAMAKKTPGSPAPSGQVMNPSVIVTEAMPANFPDDVPQHPDAKVIEARATSDLGLSLLLLIKDDASTVASYYADGLAAEGWATTVQNMPGGTAVFADKGKRTAAVTVTEGRRGAEVRMIVGHM